MEKIADGVFVRSGRVAIHSQYFLDSAASLRSFHEDNQLDGLPNHFLNAVRGMGASGNEPSQA